MKIQLVLSGTYLCQGKVYQKKGVDGKPLTYTVGRAIGKHLLAQRSERDIPYFRMVDEDVPAVIPAEKRVEKGGKPQPEADEETNQLENPAASDDAAPAAEAADDDDLSVDDVDDEADDDEEAVAL